AARAWVGGGRLLGDRVYAAMDVGVVLAVVAIHRLEHGTRLLRGGRTVEVMERLRARRREDRKVLAHPARVEAARRILQHGGLHGTTPAFSRSRPAAARAPRRAGCGRAPERRNPRRSGVALRGEPARASSGSRAALRRPVRWWRRGYSARRWPGSRAPGCCRHARCRRAAGCDWPDRRLSAAPLRSPGSTPGKRCARNP